jgi:hypothetical protein
MWESRRDFQRVWEGWKAGFMAFHAFHTLSFPRPVLSQLSVDWPQTQSGLISITDRPHPRVTVADNCLEPRKWRRSVYKLFQ